jgi:hypothetical protein
MVLWTRYLPVENVQGCSTLEPNRILFCASAHVHAVGIYILAMHEQAVHRPHDHSVLCGSFCVQAAGFEQCPLVWDDKAARQAIKVAIR